MEKRYEIFISSTFKDLIEERQVIKNIIFEQDNLATGMESFVGGRPPWHFIEKAIESCDYYILIVGGFYGSINSKSEQEGLSFTECEFRLAQKLGKEILLLMLSERGLQQLSVEKRETSDDKIRKLTEFRERIMRDHTVIEWDDLKDLKTKVPERLSRWLRENPIKDGGWVRFRELKKEESRKQILNYLFNKLNPHENVSLTLQLVEHLDEKLDSIADVINVLDWLIRIYIEELVAAPIRVYFAFSLNPEHLANNWHLKSPDAIKTPRYRLGISNSKDGRWQQGNIISGNSNIHNVYKTCDILAIRNSTVNLAAEINIPVGGEGSVIAAPVYAILPKVSIGVVGINSHLIGEATEHRGLVRELSALFSSLFYAYCKYLKEDKEWQKNFALAHSAGNRNIFKMLRDVFTKNPTPSAGKMINDLLTAHLRNEIVAHFNRVLPSDGDLIQ